MRDEASPAPGPPSPGELQLAGDPVEALEGKVGESWGAIRQARTKTDQLLSTLKGALDDLDDPDYSVVVTGSLGRGEASENSDADWILLVDGRSDPGHARIAQQIDARIREAGFKDVGPSGTFGNIVPSHELIHYIAGTRDTNENLTRRVLLLAESRALTNSMLRERVIRNVLARYVRHDPPVASKDGRFHPIPHFLLNDVVRYWRTMASDYASKMWERGRRGWGIRNIKLRFSRKVLFAWGILAAFSGDLFPSEPLLQAKEQEGFLVLLSELIREQTDRTPLELLALVAAHPDVTRETVIDIFAPYDEFLATLSNPETRRRLDDVEFDDALKDDVYDRLRVLSQQFRRGIQRLFFDEHPQLRKLIRNFGVF